jgi:hypothetical protein
MHERLAIHARFSLPTVTVRPVPGVDYAANCHDTCSENTGETIRSNLLQLRLLLTLKERATPIVRSRPPSVHMDSVWFKRTL